MTPTVTTSYAVGLVVQGENDPEKGLETLQAMLTQRQVKPQLMEIYRQ